MEILGHSTITLTMNTHSHVLPEAQREAAALMERLLANDRSPGPPELSAPPPPA